MRSAAPRWRTLFAISARTLSLCVALPAGSAHAAPPEVYGYFRNSDLEGNPLPRLEQRSATGPLEDSVSIAWNALDGLLAHYEVEYGRIRLLAENDFPEIEEGAGFNNAGPSGGWTDVLTITSPGVPNGLGGEVVLRVRVEGSVDSAGNGEACALVTFGFGSGTQVSNCSFYDRDPQGHGFGLFDSAPISFAFGSPFQVSFDASADAGGYARAPGFARTDLANSVTYAGVASVTDEGGQPVASYAIASASGFDYTVAVPEPGAAGTGAAAAAALAALTRRDSRPRWR